MPPCFYTSTNKLIEQKKKLLKYLKLIKQNYYNFSSDFFLFFFLLLLFKSHGFQNKKKYLCISVRFVNKNRNSYPVSLEMFGKQKYPDTHKDVKKSTPSLIYQFNNGFVSYFIDKHQQQYSQAKAAAVRLRFKLQIKHLQLNANMKKNISSRTSSQQITYIHT